MNFTVTIREQRDGRHQPRVQTKTNITFWYFSPSSRGCLITAVFNNTIRADNTSFVIKASATQKLKAPMKASLYLALQSVDILHFPTNTVGVGSQWQLDNGPQSSFPCSLSLSIVPWPLCPFPLADFKVVFSDPSMPWQGRSRDNSDVCNENWRRLQTTTDEIFTCGCSIVPIFCQKDCQPFFCQDCEISFFKIVNFFK